MLSDKIILLNENASDNQEALSKVADELIKSGAAKISYKSAILQREVDFPTGLATDKIGIAIPHTDAEHVNYDQIGVLRLRQPVTFLQMGDGEKVSVKFVFMLALKEAHAQLDMLQTLVALIQDEERMQQLLLAKNAEEVIALLENAGIK